MKKILTSVFAILAVVAVAAGVTYSQFEDTETSNDNTFAAGNIDLEVDGENDPIPAKFEATGMLPGNSYDTGCTVLSNVGSSDGLLSVEVNNLVSHENGILEPETGDSAGTEVDPDGYHGNTGNGELWDQITVKFCIESGAGSHATNGVCDWDDTIIKGFSSTQDDYSSTYSIKQATDLADGKNIVIPAGESKTFCSAVKFIDDQSNSWWGGQGNLTNNMAMSDDATFDITFGLSQVTP